MKVLEHRSAVRNVNRHENIKRQRARMKLVEMAKEARSLKSEEVSDQEFREKICELLVRVIAEL